MGTHPGSFSRGEYCRWTSLPQTDSDPLCARSGAGILNTGAQWHMLPQSYPNYKTVHRRFQSWCRDEVLRRVLTDVANELRDRGTLNEEECFIDATFVMAKGGGSEIGATKRGKGMKIMAIVDRHGLPLFAPVLILTGSNCHHGSDEQICLAKNNKSRNRIEALRGLLLVQCHKRRRRPTLLISG